jgi:hypothetical protein
VDCVQDRTQDATMGDACTHGMDRGHRVGLGYLVVSLNRYTFVYRLKMV